MASKYDRSLVDRMGGDANVWRGSRSGREKGERGERRGADRQTEAEGDRVERERREKERQTDRNRE